MQQNEHREQVALFNWAEWMSKQHPKLKMMFAIPNGGARHIAVARKLKAEGVKAGVPDIFLACPNEKYHGMFIELKSSKGKLSDRQSIWLAVLFGFGYEVKVAFGWQEAATAIADYLGIEAKIC